MTRLFSTIWWDMQLQFRYGFYYAGLAVALIWIVILNEVPVAAIAYQMPIFLVGNMVITTLYFVAGLVLLEKREGTLTGLVVTPLRRGEYLLSKVASLTVLVVLESGLILAVVVLVYGAQMTWGWLLLGLPLMSAIYVLLGFVFVSRYSSLNEFIMPSAIPIIVLSLPMLDYIGVWKTPFMYLIPTQSALTIMKAAILPVATWELALSLSVGAAWIALSFWLSRRAFYRFIVSRAG